jgi:hypothetical protein
MKTNFLKSALKLTVVTAITLGGLTSAFAGTVGGDVAAINTLGTQTFASAVAMSTTTPGASNALTDLVILSSTIDNNNVAGWKLTVVSTNQGKLCRAGSACVAGAASATGQLGYTNIKLVNTGGTLGAGLTNPSAQNKDILTGVDGGAVPGTTFFNTRTGVTLGTATTATVGYTFALKISTLNNTTLLKGAYSDTITLSLADDI